MSTPIKQMSTPIFNLNTDCCDEIFEYLSLRDLNSLVETCKAMQRVVGEYFVRNYKLTPKYISDNDLWMRYNNKHYYLTLFNEFITKGDINRDDFISMNISEFKSLREIFLINFCGNDKLFEEMLPQIEVIKIAGEVYFGDFYDDCLKFCKNLKEIYVYDDYDCDILLKDLTNNWLNQTYPSLEVVCLIPSYAYKIYELPTFLERNQTIRKLSVDLKFLWANGESLLKSNAKLEILKVWDLFFCDSMDIRVFCDLLDKLYKRGFYKKLHIEACDLKFIDEISTFESLESLEFDELDKNCSISRLVNLKYLAIRMFNKTILPSHITNLVNLEHLILSTVNFIDLLTFVRELAHLKKIKIEKYHGELNLIKLNKEREKLREATRVTIFVTEDIFVNTKWKTLNGDTNLKLIEMKRYDSQ